MLCIAPGQAHAATVKPSLQVNAGLGTRYRDGSWVPVQVTLRNDGPDFSGTLSVAAVLPQFLTQGNALPASDYQLPVSLPNGTQKQVTLSVPLYYDTQSVTIQLLDSGGAVSVAQTARLNPLQPADVFVGILSDQSAGFGPLNAVALPDQSSTLVPDFLNASSMPSTAAALKNFDIIVLDNFTTGSLSAAQLAALQTWVYQGGTLVEVGGPEAHRTLDALPTGLVPGSLNGTITVPANTSLLPPGWPRSGNPAQTNIPAAVGTQFIASSLVSTSTTGAPGNEIVLAYNKTPLIMQTRAQQGTILSVAFDPTLEPILSWQGASALWKGLLLRSLGDLLLPHSLNTASTSGSEQPLLASRMSLLLQTVVPKSAASPGLLLPLLLTGYILLLGPLRLILLTLFKRRNWSWRIVLSSIVVFSLLSYGLAFAQKSSSIVSNSLSIAVLNQNGTTASVTSYLGVFAPDEGNLQVHLPGNGLVQSSPDDLYTALNGIGSSSQALPSSVVPVSNGTNVNLQNATVWTMHSLVTQQNLPIQHGLVAHLTMQNGQLVGTVTNTLGYALSDALLLLPNDALKLGQLAAGATKHVLLKLSSGSLPPNNTVADLVASITNSPSYDALPAQPKTAWQRHLAMLYSIDSEGLYSSTPSLTTGQCKLPVPILPAPLCSNAATSGLTTGLAATAGWPSLSTRNADPLLVPGSPVTLIGWAENALDGSNSATIDGSHTTGFHETLIEAPLSVDLAGPLNLPPDYIEGHLVDVAGNNTQVQYPGIYTISTGSMTFEFNAPAGFTQLSGLNLSLQDTGLAQVGSPVSPDALPFQLYNWQTHVWDGISFTQGTFSSNNASAYISSNGRVLLRLANSNAALGTFAFGKPYINLQGVV